MGGGKGKRKVKKRKRNGKSEGGGSPPKMQRRTSRENLHHAPESNRIKQLDLQKEEKLKDEVFSNFRDLQARYDKIKDKGTGTTSLAKDLKKTALRDWGRKHIDKNYPGFCKDVAYAVPHCFIGKHELKSESESESESETTQSSQASPETVKGVTRTQQESDSKGEIAQCYVGQAFRLMSINREKAMLNSKGSKLQRPLFIMGNVDYDHPMGWPERVQEKYTDFIVKTECPDMAEIPGEKFEEYYTRPKQAVKDSKDGRGDADLIILDQETGVTFVEIKAYDPEDKKKTPAQKPTSGPKPKAIKEKKSKWEIAYKQQTVNKENFYLMFPELKAQKVHLVIAMPSITRGQVETEFKLSKKSQAKEVHMLTKEDLFKDHVKTPDMELDLDAFDIWWKTNIVSKSDKSTKLSLDTLKDIAARYIGTLSKPVGIEAKKERHHSRTPCDAIELAGRVFKTLTFNFKEEDEKAGHRDKVKEILKYPPTKVEYKRVHLRGPPGSGRTTMAIMKAWNFLDPSPPKQVSQTPGPSGQSKQPPQASRQQPNRETKQQAIPQPIQEPAKPGCSTAPESTQQTETNNRHVIVLDIYRGAKGRPVGRHIIRSIQESHAEFNGKVHHLPLDANDGIKEDMFAVAVRKTIPEGIKPEDLMFIIDELLPVELWEDVLKALDQENYKDSHVWCADGLEPQDLKGHADKFHTVQMGSICRIPPQVRKVLFQVSWLVEQEKEAMFGPCVSADTPKPANQKDGGGDESKSEADSKEEEGKNTDPKITKLTSTICLSTKGPIPVCIRHSDHAEKTKEKQKKEGPPTSNKILDCDECPRQLADLLMDRLMLVEKSKAGASTSTHILPCSMVILFGIPSGEYTDAGNEHVQISTSACQDYSNLVTKSTFIETLRKLLKSVEVIPVCLAEEPKKEMPSDLEDEVFWNKIPLCWVDQFQGLDRDVVIYIPSEEAATSTKKLRSRTRKLPLPGTTVARHEPIEAKALVEKVEQQPTSASDRPGSPLTRAQAEALREQADPSSSKPRAQKAESKSSPSQPVAAEGQAGSSTQTKGAEGQPSTSSLPVKETAGASSDSTAADRRKLSSLYWNTKDIDKYTDWDKTNIMFAATRCSSQLILVVP